MTILNDDEWRQVEHAYLNTAETIVTIAQRFGVAPVTIRNRRKQMGWRPRRPRAIKNLHSNGTEKAAIKAALVARFYRLLNRKLEQMETDMTTSSERTSADHEREIRALGTLIRNFEKVMGLEQESGNDGKQDRTGPAREAEAEAIRRELAERIVKLGQTGPGNDK